jgi:hypothetical protein
MKKIVAERSWSTGWKVALTVAAMVILIVLASRSSLQTASCSFFPVGVFSESAQKCG